MAYKILDVDIEEHSHVDISFKSFIVNATHLFGIASMQMQGMMAIFAVPDKKVRAKNV